MTVRVIFGKPGSGKSYHTVKVVSDILCDWLRNEKVSGERHVQRLFTNLPLKCDKLKAYVEKKSALNSTSIITSNCSTTIGSRRRLLSATSAADLS